MFGSSEKLKRLRVGEYLSEAEKCKQMFRSRLTDALCPLSYAKHLFLCLFTKVAETAVSGLKM